MKPRGAKAIMAERVEAPDSLDLFCTPPWATRALFEVIRHNRKFTVWDPACGLGHMSAVLLEYFGAVCASDIYPHRDIVSGECLEGTVDFLSDEARNEPRCDWIIVNPPFKAATAFATRAIQWAKHGAAILARTQWLEGEQRYSELFRPNPPTIVAPFVERVPMVKGCWDPHASTATSYAWFVWYKHAAIESTTLRWIPPGRRLALTKPDDLRFAKLIPAPLLEGAA